MVSKAKPIEIENPHLERIRFRLGSNHHKSFKLDEKFVSRYSDVDPGFGYNGLGEATYFRTYSRPREDGTNERWHQTVQRVVEGTYNMQKRRIEDLGKRWNEDQAQLSAREMYDRMFNMKFLPPGRGLWAMGSPITEQKGLYAALNNCAFVSTQSLSTELEKPFTFLMDGLMLGVGVGFDTRGAGSIKIQTPDKTRRPENYVIPDTREGWVKSLGLLLRSYFLGDPQVNFDYSFLREAGKPIRTFGGVASGPEPLRKLHESIRSVLNKRADSRITLTDIVDVQNMIGRAVVAGNVRRSAEIAFGDPYSEEFMNLKNYNLNPERGEWGWASNNTVFADLGMNYKPLAEMIRSGNGEPGFAWLDNMRHFGRMSDPKNDKDIRVMGGNPCLEQSLEDRELCCLVETFPNRHKSKEDFLRTLKFAYLYGKTVTLGETHWPDTNEVMARNRRIGCSMAGITQLMARDGISALRDWSRSGYDEIQRWDEIYSAWLATPRSIKTTSIKPGGTVPLLAGATPGLHFPHSRFYIRRMRVAKNNPMLEDLDHAGYRMEPDVVDSSNMVVEFPIDEGQGVRSKHETPMLEKLELTAFMQNNWSDNQVSSTVDFDPATEGAHIGPALDHYQYRLKGISFLARDTKSYPQMPYETISEDDFAKRMSKLKPLKLSKVDGAHEEEGGKYCESDKCILPGK